MSGIEYAILIFLFLVTTAVGVITGSNSLITVPVMFLFGIDEKVAVATNMFGLIFMSVGATIPFVRKGTLETKGLSPLIVLTLIGSAIGALLVGVITNAGLKLIVSAAMVAIVVFTLVKPKTREIEGEEKKNLPLTYLFVFLLAIYGGLYSGGYVTVLTVVMVAFYGSTYANAIAVTKLLNVFSSVIATILFIRAGLVDFKLGAILAVTMFVGAYIGAHFASKMNEKVLKWIFLSTVMLLAVKLAFDLLY